MIKIRQVKGVSLLPKIAPGRLIIFFTWPKKLTPGQLVLAQTRDGQVIKILAQKKNGRWRLVGRLANSSDYWVFPKDIIGWSWKKIKE